MRKNLVEVHRKIEDKKTVLESISGTKIIFPILLGLSVVGYLIYRQFDYEEFRTISWNSRVLFFLSCAILVYVLRHIFYSIRLQILSDEAFSLKKCVQLIFLWEFASSISPTSFGGSAVALFFLAQEKISAAKAVSIIIYSVIIDTLFFLVSLVFLYLLFGSTLIRPENDTFSDGFHVTFLIVWFFMLGYGLLLTWGLYRPRIIKRFLMTLASIPIIKKFRHKLYQIGEDVVITSREIRQKPLSFHINVALTTVGAWVTRFIAINFIILALVDMDFNFIDQFLLYARSQTMYVITQFSPTPGGSGVLEFMFSGFFSDYISRGIGSIAALLWRLITYYPYLIIGVIILPPWIRHIIAQHEAESDTESE